MPGRWRRCGWETWAHASLRLSGLRLAIFAGIEVRLGEEIGVEFTPPYSSEPLRVRGIVRNRKGYKYGIEFLAENPDEHERVARLRELLRFASGNQPSF